MTDEPKVILYELNPMLVGWQLERQLLFTRWEDALAYLDKFKQDNAAPPESDQTT